ncbi:MAG: winged helix DNA-binding domain-containing protein [Leucobacter sp.]
MSEALSPEDLLTLRMRAQGLAGGAPPSTGSGAGSAGASGSERIAAVARRMLALQGQDWRSSRWALGVRAAFSEGRVVRSWPMRGTIHVVAAEDIGWMQAVASRKPLAGAAKRREFLGLDDARLERLVEVSVQALTGLAARGEGLDRDGLATAWTEAGVEWRGNWRYHIIWWLCQNGIAVFGPTGGEAEPGLVLAEEWIRDPRSPDDPLAELASRYAAARGPVRAKDLAWWAGLTMSEARRGLDTAVESGELRRVRLADVAGQAGELWADPEQLGAPIGGHVASPAGPGGDPVTSAGSAADGAGSAAVAGSEADGPSDWLLLPAFDEHLLGYANRDAQLDPEHFERVVPGRNGMFLATAVHRGRVVGTWKRVARKAGGIAIAPLPGARVDATALRPALERWSAFHGLDPGPIDLAATSAD